MKKLIAIILVMMFCLTACGQNEVIKEADLKVKEAEAKVAEAERKAEEAEKKAAEAEAKLKESENLEDNSDEEGLENDSEELEGTGQNSVKTTITGQYFSQGSPYEVGFKDFYPSVIFNDKEYDSIIFDDDLFIDYIDRDSFVYDMEGFAKVEEGPYFNIEIDLSNCEDDRGRLIIRDYKVLEYGQTMEPELVDYSNQKFTDRYYQDVIYKLSLGYYMAEEQNVKDNEGYKSDKDFKEAVDKMLAKGYEIVSKGSYYRIKNENAYDISEIKTVGEMCELLGIQISDIKTREDGAYYMYSSRYGNDQIYFEVHHDEELNNNQGISLLRIKGFDFKLCGVGFGDNALKSTQMLDNKFSKIENRHTLEGDTKVNYLYSFGEVGAALYVTDFSWENDLEISDIEIVDNMGYYFLWD